MRASSFDQGSIYAYLIGEKKDHCIEFNASIEDLLSLMLNLSDQFF